MKIDYTQLYVKAHYFFFLASVGISYPYIPVYGKQLGVSSFFLGIICTVLPIVSLIAKLVFGFIIDYSQWRKWIFIVLVIVVNISFVMIFFIPLLPGPMLLDHHFQNISCATLSHCDMDYHASAIASCNGMKDTACRWICNDMNFSMRLSFYPDQQKAIISADTACFLNINDALMCQRNVTNNYNCNVTCDNFEDQCVYTSINFWSFVLLWTLGEITYCTSASTNDAICFHLLGPDKRLQYGRQRLWGALGFGVAACLSGYVMVLRSQKEIYIELLVLVLIFICIDVICCMKLQIPIKKGSTTILRDVLLLLKSKSIVIFLCFVIFSGILHTIKRYFLFWYLEDLALATGYMDNVKLLEGLIVAGENFGGEIICFFFSGSILKKFGYGYTIIFCFLCYALRYGLISSVQMLWWILPIELIMHGLTFALCLTTIVSYANVITPSGTSATVQALVQGLSDGFGNSVGSLIGGYLYKKFGGTITLRIFAIFAAFSALIYFILYVLYLKHRTLDSCNNVEWKKPDDARRHCTVAET